MENVLTATTANSNLNIQMSLLKCGGSTAPEYKINLAIIYSLQSDLWSERKFVVRSNLLHFGSLIFFPGLIFVSLVTIKLVLTHKRSVLVRHYSHAAQRTETN